jgi:hypothetical protein
MRQCSTKAVIRQLEKSLPLMFNCERANVVLVHRLNRYLYRIVKKGTEDCFSQHPLAKGITGSVVLSSKPRLTNEIDK